MSLSLELTFIVVQAATWRQINSRLPESIMNLVINDALSKQ